MIKNELATGCRSIMLRPGSIDTNGDVCEGTVGEDYRAHGLVLRRIGHVEADSAALELCIGDRPAPVPVHVDAGIAVLEDEVASSELLAAEKCAVLAAIERQVAEESTTAVVHENALLLGAFASVHLEVDILCMPVNKIDLYLFRIVALVS